MLQNCFFRIAGTSYTFLHLAKKNKHLKHLATLIPGFPMFSLVLETELLSDHWSLKEAGTRFPFKFRPDSGIFVNKIFHKKHLGKKSIFLVLPFFPVSIWKNSGQWALTVCPTADEGQQLMLSHIPAHLPGGVQQQNTMQHLPVTKHHEPSSNSETLCNISKQRNTVQHLPRATGTKMLSTLESKLDET